MGRIRTLVLAAMFLAGSGPAAAAATLIVVNKTSVYITVNVDGVYGCNTAPDTQCTIPVSEGHHVLDASDASGNSLRQEADIGPDGYTWTITSQ